MATRDRDCWIHDFSLVLTADAIGRMRGSSDYEAYTGSRLRPYPWLVLVAAVAGAFGGTLVSGALWSRWWQVPLCVAALAAFIVLVRRVTNASYQSPIGFLAGWCLFFGVVTGAFAMWGAQLDSSGWAYGIGGGLMFFLVGITGGLLEPPHSKHMEDWFLTSAITAPLGGCAGIWIYRNLLSEPGGLGSAALVGVIAALPFLAVTMALHLAAWRPARGMKKLALLLLHNDLFVDEARGMLEAAIKEDSGDAELFELRALANLLAGRAAEAEADWREISAMKPKASARDMAHGWLALRRSNPAEAARYFEAAMPARKRDAWALQGLGVARLRSGDAAGALHALKQIPGRAHDALSLTYLAEAWLGIDDLPNAIATATDAIEEADSIHGRTWLARAEAYRRRGKIDSAAEDYNRALLATEEEGVERRALDGLKSIDRPVTDDEPDC